MINILGGATSRVQPLDLIITKPFKNYAIKSYENYSKNFDKNLEVYVEGSSAAKSWILTTKWVADSWEKLESNQTW